MLNRGLFSEIFGCISTGKEANVYHASGGPAMNGRDMAIKIYKTSVLVFKDRDRCAWCAWPPEPRPRPLSAVPDTLSPTPVRLPKPSCIAQC